MIYEVALLDYNFTEYPRIPDVEHKQIPVPQRPPPLLHFNQLITNKALLTILETFAEGSPSHVLLVPQNSQWELVPPPKCAKLPSPSFPLGTVKAGRKHMNK
jgi:hypothetical protein